MGELKEFLGEDVAQGQTPRHQDWLKSEVKRNFSRPTLRCLATPHFRKRHFAKILVLLLHCNNNNNNNK